jgi:tetratricopeptide (TPR) repeat protein
VLFDLKGRRKRFVQVSYVLLAFLFAIGLVGFGIGGATSGGFLDAITGNGGGGGGGSNIYKDQITAAQRKLRLDPKDRRALRSLAEGEFNLARSSGDYDQNTGAFKEGASDTLARATSAWERYLDTRPKKPDASVAGLMIQAYATQVRFGAAGDALEAFRRAAEAQRIVAKARPSPIAYFQLAAIHYAIGEIKQGDEAGAEAVRRTPSDQRNNVKAQLADARKQGLQTKKRVKKAEEQAANAAKQARKSGQDPFGAQPGQAPLGGGP